MASLTGRKAASSYPFPPAKENPMRRLPWSIVLAVASLAIWAAPLPAADPPPAQAKVSQTESGQIEARFARVFQDNMILQREKAVPIWGWAKPGTVVEVSFAGQKKTVTADEHGYWKAILDPMKANREEQVLTAKIGDTTLTCKNVLVGEVWLSTGHSNTVSPGPNMDMGVYPVYESPGAKGGKPEIRFLMIAGGASAMPYDDLDPMSQGDSQWKVMSENPKSGVMSEMEYFARIIRDSLDVPVGILLPVSVGVGQSTWVARETLEAYPSTTGSGNYYQECFTGAEANLSRNAKGGAPYGSWAAFQKAESEWRVTKKGSWPGRTAGVVALFAYPSVSYNAKIYPLAPYAMRGFRMNADATGAPGAGELNVAMVQQYRKLFGQDLYFINCTRMRYTTNQPPLAPAITVDWQNNTIRETPKLFGGDKRQDFVELKDLGDWLSHYYGKAEAGRRLGLCALNLAYGQHNIYSGPRMSEAKIDGNKATVRFDLVGDGLVYQPSIDGISGVYLRSTNGQTRWAQVKVLGKDTIEFSHSDLADLQTVAYGQNAPGNPHETLFNSVGLPASGFAVNPVKGVFDRSAPYQILSIDKNDLAKSATVKEAMLSLAHVRRHGYVFQIVGKEKVDFALQPIKEKVDAHMETSTATIPVTAYIPAEWKDFEVVAGEKDIIWWENGNIFSKGQVKAGWTPLKTVETTKNGARFVTFDSPVDQTWVIVAEAGHAEEFRKIHRF
jgi:sialate O-acetylesterase